MSPARFGGNRRGRPRQQPPRRIVLVIQREVAIILPVRDLYDAYDTAAQLYAKDPDLFAVSKPESIVGGTVEILGEKGA